MIYVTFALHPLGSLPGCAPPVCVGFQLCAFNRPLAQSLFLLSVLLQKSSGTSFASKIVLFMALFSVPQKKCSQKGQIFCTGRNILPVAMSEGICCKQS